MTSKIAKGSIVILLGAFLFRIGGWIYRVLMANLLGPAGYGILGLTFPSQGFLMIIAGAGLPPAIAKFVAEYNAKKDYVMVKRVISVSTKLMVILGIAAGVIMYLIAEPLALYFHKPEAILPFKLIGLITPFSVVVGALRGSFQGLYQMTNILITRAFEQFFMITIAVALVLAGAYVAGAVIGTAAGYLAAMFAAIFLFRKHVWNKISHPHDLLSRAEKKFTLREDLGLIKMLLLFSIPVVITGLAELGIYDLGTFVVAYYMPSESIGYYNAASPIARLPLIISMAVATSVLPATSEAMGLRDMDLLHTYILQSYRYVTLAVLPLCVGMIIFATPILRLIYFGPSYIPGSVSLQILASGMLFFTLYSISSSISQGLGKPMLPMIVLIFGTAIDLGLSILLVPYFGINGAAVATAIASFIIMAVVGWKTLQLAELKLPMGEFGKIIIASLLMGVVFLFFPQTRTSFILAMIIAPFLYIGILSVIGGLKKDDIRALYKLGTKLGPISGYFNKIVGFFERFATD
jgi:stage V sporulation protein B